MHAPEFRRHLVEYVPDDALTALRLATKPLMREIDNLLRRIVANGGQRGKLLVHDANDIRAVVANSNDFKGVRKLATRVVFLLNITKIGINACKDANLVVVDIPEGVVVIVNNRAFYECRSLATLSFPTTLITIFDHAFLGCHHSRENVDLLHTNFQEIGYSVFWACLELKSMTIPDSLQTFGNGVFHECSKLVPSNIDVIWGNDYYYDPTFDVITYLRLKQKLAEQGVEIA